MMYFELTHYNSSLNLLLDIPPRITEFSDRNQMPQLSVGLRKLNPKDIVQDSTVNYNWG